MSETNAVAELNKIYDPGAGVGASTGRGLARRCCCHQRDRHTAKGLSCQHGRPRQRQHLEALANYPENPRPLASRLDRRRRLAVVQRLHHGDANHHGIAADLRDQQQQLGRCLPLRQALLGCRHARDVTPGIAQGDERAAAADLDRLEELAIPGYGRTLALLAGDSLAGLNERIPSALQGLGLIPSAALFPRPRPKAGRIRIARLVSIRAVKQR